MSLTNDRGGEKQEQWMYCCLVSHRSPSMISIAQVCQVLRTLFEEEAVLLARRAGLRERTIPFARLAYVFVLGWWHPSNAGPSALDRFAGGVGRQMRKDAVDANFTC